MLILGVSRPGHWFAEPRHVCGVQAASEQLPGTHEPKPWPLHQDAPEALQPTHVVYWLQEAGTKLDARMRSKCRFATGFSLILLLPGAGGS
jgi:hypothetical protein